VLTPTVDDYALSRWSQDPKEFPECAGLLLSREVINDMHGNYTFKYIESKRELGNIPHNKQSMVTYARTSFSQRKARNIQANAIAITMRVFKIL
jgi:hypothetical protein